MAVEPRRACGYRKIGGIYLVAAGAGFECGRLPLPLNPCSTCGSEIQFTRGLQKIDPVRLLSRAAECKTPAECARCPFDRAFEHTTAGLMWVGESFYETPAEFTEEAAALGISKRIAAVPKWLKVMETWIFLAHRLCIRTICYPVTNSHKDCKSCDGRGYFYKPGVFRAFIPRAVQQIIPDTMPHDQRVELTAQGFELIEVPANDRDHAAGPSKRAKRQMDFTDADPEPDHYDTE